MRGTSEALALITTIEECRLSDQEVADFLTAAKNVARHYDIKATQKAVDFYALTQVSFNILSPRIASVARRNRRPAASGTVVYGRFGPEGGPAAQHTQQNGSATPPAVPTPAGGANGADGSALGPNVQGPGAGPAGNGPSIN